MSICVWKQVGGRFAYAVLTPVWGLELVCAISLCIFLPPSTVLRYVCFISFQLASTNCKPLFFYSLLSLSEKHFLLLICTISEKVTGLGNDENLNIACICIFPLCSFFFFQDFLHIFVYFVDSFISLTVWLIWNCDLFCAVQFAIQFESFGWQFGIMNYAACLTILNLCNIVTLCISYFIANIFPSLFVNQEQSCDLQRGQTNWFRPVTFNDEF